MEIEKGSVKRRKKCSKRSWSPSTSSEDKNSGSPRRKRRLKESKLTKNNGKNLMRSLSDAEEGYKGDKSDGKTREKRRKRKVKRRGESEDSSSWSSSESEQWRRKKWKEKKRKEKKKKKKIKKKVKELKKQQEGSMVKIKAVVSENEDDKEGQQEDMLSGPKPMQSIEEPRRRAMVPMTKEEYEKQQSKVRRVFDPDTGRERLVKGDGEIVEEVVSYERHKEINKLSTFGDGAAFQKSLGLNRYTDNKIYRS